MIFKNASFSAMKQGGIPKKYHIFKDNIAKTVILIEKRDYNLRCVITVGFPSGISAIKIFLLGPKSILLF